MEMAEFATTEGEAEASKAVDGEDDAGKREGGGLDGFHGADTIAMEKGSPAEE